MSDGATFVDYLRRPFDITGVEIDVSVDISGLHAGDMLENVVFVDNAPSERIEQAVPCVPVAGLLGPPGVQEDIPLDPRPVDAPLADPHIAPRMDITNDIVDGVILVPKDNSAGVGFVDDILLDKRSHLEIIGTDGAMKISVEDVVDVILTDYIAFSGPGNIDDGAVTGHLPGSTNLVLFDHVVLCVQVTQDFRPFGVVDRTRLSHFILNTFHVLDFVPPDQRGTLPGLEEVSRVFYDWLMRPERPWCLSREIRASQAEPMQTA